MADFELLPTPSPTEFVVRIRVSNERIPEGLELAPATGTLVRYLPLKKIQWVGVISTRINEYGDYVYTHSTVADDKHTYFHFAKTRTDLERDTPFETSWINRDYPWPAVLEDLYFVQSIVPQIIYDGTNVQKYPRIYVRQKYRPSASINSLIKVEQYLSEAPWPAKALTHRQPIPTEVSGSFLGVDFSFPKCLHPRIVIPELAFNASIITGAGVVSPSRGGISRGQIFPETTFTDWRPFVIQDAVEPTNGLWLREKMTIYPPARLESVEN